MSPRSAHNRCMWGLEQLTTTLALLNASALTEQLTDAGGATFAFAHNWTEAGDAAASQWEAAQAINWTDTVSDWQLTASDWAASTTGGFATNFTANQTEWAQFMAECYGVEGSKAAAAAVAGNAACGLLPISCPFVAAYSLYQNYQAAVALSKEGVDGIDPCSEVRKAYPTADALLAAPAAAASQPARASAAQLLAIAALPVLAIGLLRDHRRRLLAHSGAADSASSLV